jgi:hypothetical protein
MSNGTTVTMEVREEPKFVQFSTGDVIEGLLLNIDRIKVKDNAAIRYTVQQDDGQCVSFLGTHQLNTKLRTTDRGHRIEITCEGEDTMVKRGDNCMKVFNVKVSKEVVTRDAALLASSEIPEITDDDIPF